MRMFIIFCVHVHVVYCVLHISTSSIAISVVMDLKISQVSMDQSN